MSLLVTQVDLGLDVVVRVWVDLRYFIWRATIEGIFHLRVHTHLLQLVVDVACAAVQSRSMLHAPPHVTVNRVVSGKVI